MKMKKAKLIAIIVIALILLFPDTTKRADGGTIEYQAILYSVTKWHRISILGPDFYKIGTEIKIFGITIFDNSGNQPE